MHAADSLRTLRSLQSPDPRSTVRGDATPEERIAAMKSFVLNDEVPEAIRIHFETAKNLYVYAWFVYRFHVVANQHLYGTMEMALRTKLDPDDKLKRSEKTLGPLLARAAAEGFLANNKFSAVQHQARRRARTRRSEEIIEEMRRLNLDSFEWDEEQVVVSPEDYPDMLSVWVKTIPKMRNELAHGTSSLWPWVHGTFEITMELVNQLFPNEKSEMGRELS